MGGTLSEVIRKTDGTIVKRERGTGAYNKIFISEDFNNNAQEKAIEDHLELIVVPEDIYPLAPFAYGLVVIDMLNKKIHSLQGYDTPGIYNIISISQFLWVPQISKKYDDLLKQNKFMVYENGTLLGDCHEVFGNDISFEKINKMVKLDNNPLKKLLKTIKLIKNEHILFIDFKPKSLLDFEIIKYEESTSGILELAKNLKKDGFSFDERDKKAWLDFAKNYYDHELLVEDNMQWSDKEYKKQLEIAKEEYKTKLENVLTENNRKFKM